MADGLLTNYYSQKSLDLVIKQQLSLPNAIYIDGFDEEGSIRTGTGHYGFQQSTHTKPTKRKQQVASDHEETRFCYVDTLLLWTVRKSCAQNPVAESLFLMIF